MNKKQEDRYKNHSRNYDTIIGMAEQLSKEKGVDFNYAYTFILSQENVDNAKGKGDDDDEEKEGKPQIDS